MNLKISLGAGKNIRLFKNPVLEKLTYVHPLAPVTVWGAVLIAAFAYSLKLGVSAEFSFLLFLAGLFVWTLAEYLLHRFFFHYHATSPLGQRFFYLIHGVHHDDPDDHRRILMPISAGVLLAVPLFTLFYFILGDTHVFAFFSGFLLGYLFYDYIHFFTHFGRFKSGFMKIVQRQHMVHHFAKPDALFGVSSPLWDYMFGTKK